MGREELEAIRDSIAGFPKALLSCEEKQTYEVDSGMGGC